MKPCDQFKNETIEQVMFNQINEQTEKITPDWIELKDE